eukprot:TRINITY_DN4292_c0_g1_i1.p1 TRINITY_DN4292_c0_g1~~TRINITY_DN4292_c0_g1_i1.p1  ORF type:complete len:113 (+),score=30.84 TRINITY_DN4292_c0_g1_i1:21-359(+)
MSYDNVLGGKLKLKGSALPSGIKKKKKKATPTKDVAEKILETENKGEQEVRKPIVVVHQTAAERSFIEKQQKRERERIAGRASKSHREKVEEFNKKLNDMTEHNDIPKVGPG